MRRTLLVLVSAALVVVPSTASAAQATQPAAGRPHVVDTIHVPGGASIVTSDPTSGRVYVGNVNDGRITVIDGRSGTIRATAHGPCCGEYGLAVDPRTDTVYAAGIDDNLYVIDGRTHQVRTVVDVSRGGLGAPGVIAIDPVLGRVFVTSVYDNIVTVVDAGTDKVTTTFALPDVPLAAAADPANHRVYFSGDNAVWAVDTRTHAVVRTTDIGRTAGDVAVDPTHALVYVTSTDDSTLTVVSTVSGHVVRRVSVGSATGDALLSVAADPRTGLVYVASYDAKAVVVISGCTGRVIGRVHLAGAPVDVDVNAKTGKAYAVDSTASVRVIAG